MTKLRLFEIRLINPQIVYFPGQVVQGQVVVELTDAMKMRGIRVKVKGKGHVYWSSGSGDNRRTYSATENYVEESIVLCGRGSHEEYEMSLPLGQHVFPFQFVLPLGLPGSFEGKSNCYVRYWLKANIDRPWKFDPETKFLFTMGSVLDLNTLADAGTPSQTTQTKTVCCCCCESGPITATFKIGKKGYVPGEAIIFDAEITENTGRGAHSSRVKLVMITTYKTHGGSTKREKTDCVRLEHGSINPGGTDVWSNERLVVPPLPPSFLPGCSIIEIDYYVELKVDVCDTPFDLELPLDVYIGTIPLQSVVQQYRPPFEPGVITNQPAGFSANVNFDLPPPSYQECVFGKVDTTDDDDKHASGSMSYAPSYTYYDWLNPPPGGTNVQPTAPPPSYGFT